MTPLESRKNYRRKGQSIIELLIGITIGALLIVAATAAIAPALRSNTQTQKIQTAATLGKELLDNLKTWSDANWNSMLALATGTTWQYYLNTSSSPYTIANGVESLTIVPGAAATSSLLTGLVGYWPFDEGAGTTVRDYSGNNHNATLYNDLVWDTGKIGVASLLSNGSTSQVIAANTASLRYAGGDMTLSVWVKPDATDNGGYIISKPWNGGGGYNYYLTNTGGPSQTIKLTVAGATGYTLASTQPISAGSWHLVTATIDASSHVALFMDGVQSASGTSTVASWVPGAPGDQNVNVVFFCIFPYGNNSCAGSSTYVFKGSMDDVRVYNRALSPAEVTQLYALGQSSVTYTRYFYLTDVYRDGSGNVVTSGGGYDPSSKQITVVYSWANGTTNSMSTILTRTRNAVFSQNDWSGGPGQNTAVTSTNNQFATSSNIDYTTTTGAFYLAIPGY